MRTLMKIPRRALRAGSALIIVFSFLSPRLDAQVNATATVTGQVTDQSGAVVPGATVKVTNQGTGVVFTRDTAVDGFYTVPLLPPGGYSIQVSASGFATLTRQDITVQINQVAQEDFRMQVSAVATEVTVQGGAPLLNTQSTEIGNVISQAPTEMLPLNGRNFSQLGYLVPGTNPGPIGGIRTQGNGNETQRAGAEIIADGSRGTFNLFMIDGLDDRDQSVGTLKVFPNLESIEEFKVQMGNYDAEYAAGGAVVNVITRSGSNQLHGSAFEFLRNTDLDCRQFFDGNRPPYQQSQFGFAVGGPIIRNKTFFFGDFQGLRTHQSSSVILTEPTAAMRNGDFSAYPAVIYNPATYNATTNTRTPFPNNQIGPLNPIAQNLLALFPLPNLSGVSNNLRVNPLEATRQNEYDIRVDQVISNTDSMFGRVTHGGANITWPDTPVLINGVIDPYAFAKSGTAGNLAYNHDPSDQGTLQEIHQFSPNVTNQLALGYTRVSLTVLPLEEGDNLAATLGVLGANNTGQFSGGMVSLGLSSETGFSEANIPELVPQNTLQLTDNLSYVRGAHSMRFGFTADHNDFGFWQLTYPAGYFNFTGTYTNNPASSKGTGAGFADFMLGLPVSSSKTVAPGGEPYNSYTEYGAFVQDQWRVSRKLSVNFGIRWDMFTPVVERDNRLSDLILTPTGTLDTAGQNGISRSIIALQKHHFSPRVGLAYHLTDKTVARAAYGLFYFNEQGIGGSTRLFINYPFSPTYIVNCASTTPCLSTSNPIPITFSSGNLPTAVYQPLSGLTPNIQEWNFTLERQLTSSLIVRGTYVGSHGNHLNINLNENVSVPGPGSVPSRAPYPSYSTISAWEPRGLSNYNGLQLSAEKRMSYGLFFLAAYSFGMSLDEGEGGNSTTGESRINIQNPQNVHADYGWSGFDIRNRFTLSEMYGLPFGRGRHFLSKANREVDALIGGWQLNSIVTLQAGMPFSVSMATATDNTGTFQRPNRICNGNLPASQQSISTTVLQKSRPAVGTSLKLPQQNLCDHHA